MDYHNFHDWKSGSGKSVKKIFSYLKLAMFSNVINEQTNKQKHQYLGTQSGQN